MSDRRLRLTYNRVNLEIMAPSPEHELSKFFLNLPIPAIAGFLQQAETMDYLKFVKAFRNWVRSQIGQ